MKKQVKVEAILYAKREDVYVFLLLKRSEQDGGFWQPLTGTVEGNESLEACLCRELAEETGIESMLSVSKQIHHFTWKKGDILVTERVFAVQVSEGARIELSEEHTAFKWCSYEEAVTTLAMPENKKALKLFYQEVRKVDEGNTL